jgi:hypothetical protein
MLRLNHPMTEYIFRASALMDGVLFRGQRMSVSPNSARTVLLAECLPLLAEMRELASAQFANRAVFICEAVNEYEAAIRTLASLGGSQITEDRRDGTGDCSVCGTAITHYKEHRIIECGECTKPFMAAYDKLDSSEGFSTFAI